MEERPPVHLRVGLPDTVAVRGLLVQNDDGTRSGYARELIEGAAKEVEITLEFVPLAKGDTGLRRLAEGELDAIVPVSPSHERMEIAEFTAPILIANGAVFFRDGESAPRSIEDLMARRVAVALNGVAHLFCVEKKIPYVAYPTLKETLESVLSGESDCALTPQTAGRVEMERWTLAGLDDRPLDEDRLRFTYAIAVRRGSSDVVARLNTGLEILRQDGRWDELYDRWVEPYQPRGRPIEIPTSVLVGVLGLAVASTLGLFVLRSRLKRRTVDLRESEQRFRAVAESLPALVYSHLVHTDGRCVRRFATSNSNDWLREFPALALGSDDRRMLLSIHPEDRALYEGAREAARRQRTRFDAEFRLRDQHERYRWLHSTSTPIEKREGVLWQSLLLDVTPLHEAREERHRLELELLRSQRLEGLGLLAGGIAHDFNNLLVGIQGNLELADRGDGPVGTSRGDAVRAAVQRATELTRQLLAYAGEGHLSEEVIDLSRLVRETIEQQRGDDALGALRITLELADPTPLVKADGVLLRQVVVNLLAHVRASARSERPTRVIVRTGVRDEVPAAQRDALGSASPLGLGRHAFLEVEDSGRVLDETFLRHIFDPFFAARVSSRGIALAIAQRVVERQRGAIYAWSAPERGTTFVVLLPEVQPAPVREVAFVPHARRAGRVLVVDDDPGVLEVTCAMLASRGWAVQRAATAAEGLATLRNGLPDVVLLDLTLPRHGKGDQDLADVVRAEFPDLSIVLMSGLSTARADGELGCADGFVPKPFTGAELHGALERALARRPSRQPQPAS